MENVNELGDVQDIAIEVVFETSSTEYLVIETKNLESFDGITTDGTNRVVNNIVEVTKIHSAELFDNGFLAFSTGAPYSIMLKIKLNELPTQQLQVQLNLNFNIYKSSDYIAYSTEEIDGNTYYTFGSFPQSQVDITGLSLTDTHTNYMAYDDAGGVTYRDIYEDQNGNQYVKIDNAYDTIFTTKHEITQTTNTNYYLIEPIKWKTLETTNGKAMLLCENILEEVEYYTDIAERLIDGKTIYPNNYMHSTLRNYLNNTFYYSAFNSLEMALISITEVDNSRGDSRYVCDNTFDYVFALSLSDLVNSNYGFKTEQELEHCEAQVERLKRPSAYATGTGVYTWKLSNLQEQATNAGKLNVVELLSEDTLIGSRATLFYEELLHINSSGRWMSRSTCDDYSNQFECVHERGEIEGWYLGDSWQQSTGVVPALCINTQY